MIGRLKRAVDRRTSAVIERLDSQAGRVARLEEQVEQLARANDALRAVLEDRVAPLLTAIVADEPSNRRRLYALRATPDYAAPFEVPDPLVSVTLPTRDRPELLERSLRSLLAQTHQRLEILVVGDAAGPDVAEAVAGIGDPRVHYANLTQRVDAHPPAPLARGQHDGAQRGRHDARRGAWVLHFDDDDTLRPDAVASLLALARESRAEVVYGGFEQRAPSGEPAIAVAFPPQEGQFGWQGALVHRGLGFFERELVAAHLDLPGDMYLLRRMLSAGCGCEQLGQVTFDYYPSKLWP